MLSVCVCFSGAAFAQCSGVDLRATLSETERLALNQRVATTPFAQGNHWVATRAGITLHIVGTVHMPDARLTPIANRLAPIIAQSTTLWLEATKAEEKKLQDAVLDRPELLFLTEGPTLPDLMEDQDWRALADAATARGIPSFMAAKFQPWYLSLLLSLPACAVAQTQSGAQGLDKMLGDIAETHGILQLPLEPYDTLFSLMGTEPMEEQINFLTLGVLPNDVAEDSLTTLLASYFDENTVEVLEMTRIVAKRQIDLPPAELDRIIDEMLDALLVTRNQAWMERLKNVQPGISVIAVGAGHLPGEFGLLNLLQQDGYTLQRAAF